MLPMKYIPQLIGHTFGIAYLDIHVVVGVAIYPVIDAAILDVVFQFNRESSVSLAFGKLGALHLEGWDMMGYDNLICLLQGDPGPQCGYDEVNVTYMYYGIIIAVDIRAYFKAIAIVQLCDVVELVELMVAHTGYYLLVVLRCPVPEGMFGIVVIPQVADVASQNENVPCHLQTVSSWLFYGK